MSFHNFEECRGEMDVHHIMFLHCFASNTCEYPVVYFIVVRKHFKPERPTVYIIYIYIYIDLTNIYIYINYTELPFYIYILTLQGPWIFTPTCAISYHSSLPGIAWRQLFMATSNWRQGLIFFTTCWEMVRKTQCPEWLFPYYMYIYNILCIYIYMYIIFIYV